MRYNAFLIRNRRAHPDCHLCMLFLDRNCRIVYQFWHFPNVLPQNSPDHGDSVYGGGQEHDQFRGAHSAQKIVKFYIKTEMFENWFFKANICFHFYIKKIDFYFFFYSFSFSPNFSSKNFSKNSKNIQLCMYRPNWLHSAVILAPHNYYKRPILFASKYMGLGRQVPFQLL